MRRRDRRYFGMTLVELLVALVVMSIISVGVTTMLTGASKTSLYVTNGTDSLSQVEIAYRRIMHNLQACSAINAPTTTTAGSTLTVVTQPDAGNSNQTYTVTYTLTGTNLTETDSRYSPATANTLVSGVTAFTVQRKSLASPQAVTVTITAGTLPVVTRSFTAYCRNL